MFNINHVIIISITGYFSYSTFAVRSLGKKERKLQVSRLWLKKSGKGIQVTGFRKGLLKGSGNGVGKDQFRVQSLELKKGWETFVTVPFCVQSFM